MHLPELKPTEQRTLMTNVFLGYNENDAIQDGEMADMKNLSSRSYPLLDQREKRATLGPKFTRTVSDTAPANPSVNDIWIDTSGSAPVIKQCVSTQVTPLWNTCLREYSGIQGGNKLVTLEGSRVLYNRNVVDGIYTGQYSVSFPKQIVRIGSYVCIWPDKIYFNTSDLTDSGSMSGLRMVAGNQFKIKICKDDGSDYTYDRSAVSSTAPSPVAGSLWIDTSTTPHKLKMGSASNEWVEILKTYVRISRDNGIGNFFTDDDIKISGMKYANQGDVSDEIEALNGDKTIVCMGEDYMVIEGFISSTAIIIPDSDTVRIEREIPNLDYICESNNRLWGCKFGTTSDGFVNEIRACKLGDFRNWNSLKGLSTDSYAASVGSDGPFTGAVSQHGYPVFFKENCIHRVTGTEPSTFSISTTGLNGVQQGSWRSIVKFDENVYFKSRDGICYFDGSMTYDISDQLGGIEYSDARAGALNNKYYISMKDANGIWHLMVYDTRMRLWHIEDDMKVMAFGESNGELYAIDEDADEIVMITGKNPEGWTVKETEEDFDWRAVFGLFGTDYTNQKYLSRFNLRMQMDEDALVHLSIMYDQDGVWHDQGEIRGRSTRTFMLPVVPRRCDHLQVKLSGRGRCRVYSISRVLEVGGDG